MPAFAVKALFGEMGEALLLAGARVVPEKLQAAGYIFIFPELKSALDHLLS
jgi:NAD dependent epimerase/dehydratase family enzyme